jgi:hypothetical protein
VVLERERSSQIGEKGVVREAMPEIKRRWDRDSQRRVDSCLPLGKGIEQMQMPKETSGSSERISRKIIMKIPEAVREAGR